jgi:hypothetical protein
MSKTKAFIINYNRLDLMRNMADYLADGTDVEPIIIDNNSTYPKLLEYYDTCSHKVERMDKNWGNCVVWISGILDKYDLKGNFIVTDSDLNISNIPKDFLHKLQTGLDRHQFACKAGFGLEINNLPITELSKLAIGWECLNWANRVDELFFDAPIDTTFCLCRTRLHDFRAIRSDYPYVAQHVPWTYSKDSIPEDEKYYFEHVTQDYNYYSIKIKNL